MKVQILVEYSVEPKRELTAKEHSNMVGMLRRLTRNRLQGIQDQLVGGEKALTGWEVFVTSVEVAPIKTK